MFSTAAEEKRKADLLNDRQPDAVGDGPFGGHWDDYDQPAPPQGGIYDVNFMNLFDFGDFAPDLTPSLLTPNMTVMTPTGTVSTVLHSCRFVQVSPRNNLGLLTIHADANQLRH